MSPELIGAIGFAVMMLLMLIGIPVAISMLVTGLVGYALLTNVYQASTLASLWATSTIRDYTIAILPVFLLMGELGDISGMMKEAYRSANTWLGNLPGGLAMASILGAAGFSAVSGSSMVCAVVMGRIALPHLIEHKYDPSLATGALAAGGTLGNLIPPGILLVFYAVLTETSLGKLFIACLLPSVLLVVMYLVQIYLQCRLKPSLGPRAGSTTWRQKFLAINGMVAVTVVFAIIMGGIYLGVFTPNEAASVATVVVFIYALMRRTLNGQTLIKAFKSTLMTSGMSFAIIISANIFSAFTAVSQLSQTLATWLMSLNLSALGLVILIMVIYFILGIPMGPMVMMLLTLPIFLPILIAYNINLLWFGVLVIVQMELSQLSPPVGMNLFVIAAMGKPYGISMSTVFRGALPFCVTMLVFNIILIAFPQIALFLVNKMTV